MKTLTIKCDKSDGYEELVKRCLLQEFPQFHNQKDRSTIFESVVEEIIGTKKTRLGPRPNPESLVLIRSIIRSSMEKNEPINILIPGAAIKLPLGSSLDLSEVFAMKMIHDLHNNVIKHYSPGIKAFWRLEDLTEIVLSKDRSDIPEITKVFKDSIRKLNRILGYNDVIRFVAESEITTKQEWMEQVSTYQPIFLKYLKDTEYVSDELHESRLKSLNFYGWRGIISQDMRNFLYDRYRVHYPNKNISQFQEMIADYYSCILTRKNLHAAGIRSEIPKIDISFVPTRPDAFSVSSRIHYRTISKDYTSNHLPPWCAKTVINFNEKDRPKINLRHWWDDMSDVTKSIIQLSNDSEIVDVEVFYS